MSSSSSRSSNTLTRSDGMSSLKPVTNALNCSSTRFWILHSVISLQQLSQGSKSTTTLEKAYSIYSFLFSLVTSMFLPLGFKSMVLISPKLSSSVENVGSITPSISFSLHISKHYKYERERESGALQCPSQRSMEIGINPLHICKSNSLL